MRLPRFTITQFSWAGFIAHDLPEQLPEHSKCRLVFEGVGLDLNFTVPSTIRENNYWNIQELTYSIRVVPVNNPYASNEPLFCNNVN